MCRSEGDAIKNVIQHYQNPMKQESCRHPNKKKNLFINTCFSFVSRIVIFRRRISHLLNFETTNTNYIFLTHNFFRGIKLHFFIINYHLSYHYDPSKCTIKTSKLELYFNIRYLCILVLNMMKLNIKKTNLPSLYNFKIKGVNCAF